jgi:hypothetical protein
METPVISLKNMMEGMPVHPVMEDRPILWADPGDYWLFRRTTNILVPKIADTVAIEDTLIRYTACAIKRALENGGGVDFVIWQEREEIQPDKRTSVVVPVAAFGPSRMVSREEAEHVASMAMVAFVEVYKNPVWISQYEHTDGTSGES